MYGIVLQNFQKRIQNVYKTYSFRIQISYRATIIILNINDYHNIYSI